MKTTHKGHEIEAHEGYLGWTVCSINGVYIPDARIGNLSPAGAVELAKEMINDGEVELPTKKKNFGDEAPDLSSFADREMLMCTLLDHVETEDEITFFEKLIADFKREQGKKS